MNRLADLFFTLAKNENASWSETETAVQNADLPALLKELIWLKSDTLHICHLHSFPDFRRMAKDGRLLPAEPRMCTWGMAWNGLCITQPVREEKGVGEGCSLSQVLIPDAPERCFLSAEQMEKLLYRAKTDTSGMSVLTEEDADFGKEAA